MKNTPVTFRNLKVGKAEHYKMGVWLVPIAVELTDPVSVLSSLYSFELLRPSLPRADIDVIMPPPDGALRYVFIKQKLIVSCLEEYGCAVNVCRNDDGCKRSDNPLNYAMDAGRVIVDENDVEALSRLVAEEGNEMYFRIGLWLRRVIENLDLPHESMERIVSAADGLYAKGPRVKPENIKARVLELGRVASPVLEQAATNSF
jgi:hypothetical protein